MGIVKSRKEISTPDLHTLEAYWMDRLDTLNTGLNTRDETKSHLDQHILNANEHFQHSPNCFPYIAAYITETAQDKI